MFSRLSIVWLYFVIFMADRERRWFAVFTLRIYRLHICYLYTNTIICLSITRQAYLC